MLSVADLQQERSRRHHHRNSARRSATSSANTSNFRQPIISFRNSLPRPLQIHYVLDANNHVYLQPASMNLMPPLAPPPPPPPPAPLAPPRPLGPPPIPPNLLPIQTLLETLETITATLPTEKSLTHRLLSWSLTHPETFTDFIAPFQTWSRTFKLHIRHLIAHTTRPPFSESVSRCINATMKIAFGRWTNLRDVWECWCQQLEMCMERVKEGGKVVERDARFYKTLRNAKVEIEVQSKRYWKTLRVLSGLNKSRRNMYLDALVFKSRVGELRNKFTGVRVDVF
ncbi:hypothetical protein HDU97_000786 [Phlyctochytrium planicorne]|nr:hypothetical protein HDU97_000786 [Phlyctochytrium planicorne]